MSVSLRSINNCFEGALPAGIASCSAEGMPNVTYVSQVHLVDDRHVAVTYQFFNKTRSNILENPQVSLLLIDPYSGVQYRLGLIYKCTEASGAVFDALKAKLDAVASMSGMSHVFHLKGVDIYEVVSTECMEENAVNVAPGSLASFSELNEITQAISGCDQLGLLLDTTLTRLADRFGMSHSMILFLNDDGQSLYTIASHGYVQQGAGAEVRIGEGIIGTAAQQARPIKISNMQRENIMADAVRQQANSDKQQYTFEPCIKLPGMQYPNSQLAVPIEAKNTVLGVLFLESEKIATYTRDMQDLVCSIANHLGTAILLCDDETHDSSLSGRTESQPPVTDQIDAPEIKRRIKIRYYQADRSIFVDNDYLIKGVAGIILKRLLDIYLQQGRSEFTNRELRRDAELCLPEVADNLEARLVLLQRRLEDKCPGIKMEKTGRGRFRLLVHRPVDLMSVS